MLIKLNNKNKQKGNNMTYEQKKFEGYTEGQMAREILMNAIAEALDTENKHVRTELEQIGVEYTLGKMFRVRKHLAKMAHKIFFKYGHKADFDMSGSPLVEIFDEYKWEDPR